MLRLDPTWLLAVVPEGLVLLGPESEVEVEVPANRDGLERVAEALATGADKPALARDSGLRRGEAGELVSRLVEEGALVDGGSAPGARPTPLAEAVLAAYDGAAPRHVWTAEELLVLPAGTSSHRLRRALRAFIAGLESHLRLRAYAQLALRRRRTVWGDLPEPRAAERALERAAGLPPDAIHVLALGDGAVESVRPERLEEIGGHVPHRLGPVLTVHTAPGGPANARFFLSSARYAHPNLRFPGAYHSRGSGFGRTRDEAELVARAEAVERYAPGDLSAHRLARAAEAELEGAVSPDALCRYNRRQYAERFGRERYDPEGDHLWVRAETLDGSRRWLAAGSVFFPFTDPERPDDLPPASSSGVAAHTDTLSARHNALAELVERDAFMWTWIQRVSRERLDRRGLDERTRAIVREIESRRRRVDFVNLTLDTWPVVLCAVRGDFELGVSAACARTAREAAAKCALEASVPALWDLLLGTRPLQPEQVVGPRDHRLLYARGEAPDAAEFLVASGEEIAVEDVDAGDRPLEALVGSIAEPVFVELSSPATRPFRVVRAAVPGMVPISFGYDREPLGMPRLARPLSIADGRRLGRPLDLAETGPLMPHPFP